MEVKICQSCGMPMKEEEQFGKNADSSKNDEYCCYCYPNGAFSKEETMEEMIECCIPFVLQDGEFKQKMKQERCLQTIFQHLRDGEVLKL